MRKTQLFRLFYWAILPSLLAMHCLFFFAIQHWLGRGSHQGWYLLVGILGGSGVVFAHQTKNLLVLLLYLLLLLITGGLLFVMHVFEGLSWTY